MSKELNKHKPEILAPAGSRASFLAALAAGADAVYCGLKSFSARMEAKNFKTEELAALTALAHEQGARVYVTINSILKPDDLEPVGRILTTLERDVHPDALIVQDMAMVKLARQADFSGELHLSTLANAGFPAALETIRADLEVDRVVLPRELNVDEIKDMARACPKDLKLETFIHGALCYGVSGRCYWSSYYGGKSGLRGRCVQPCRRLYSQDKKSARFFSCQDLSIDVLVKVLLSIPEVTTWKIEGRKKGPHYVFYTVKAYQMLRDQGKDPKVKKNALAMLERALGRNTTHYNFLTQRIQSPVNTSGHTGSGLLMGKVQGTRANPWFVAREELLTGDVLRIGYEDQKWHAVHRVSRYVPKKGHLHLKISSGKNSPQGAPVFLTDRREKVLVEMIDNLEAQLEKKMTGAQARPDFRINLPRRFSRRIKTLEMNLFRNTEKSKSSRGVTGLWLSAESIENIKKNRAANCWWWLPPVIWPQDEEDFRDQVNSVLKQGAGNFVLNAPWQMAFFPPTEKLNLWAGPFCNIANPLGIAVMAEMGFSGVIVSPELGSEDYQYLPQNSPLPLGIVIAGNWPLCISRVLADNLKPQVAFASPRGEESWVQKYGSNYWVYPNWRLDLSAQRKTLEKAGYRLFVDIDNPLPPQVSLKKRPGLWNWNIGLA